MDEYGYYAVKGFAVVPAQARSLGFSAIFAGQDLPAFQKASKEEAASIGANSNIKICMKLEDPQETWEFFNKVAGETYVTNVSGFQMDAGSMTMNYMDTRSASVEKRQRIDLLDLKDQRQGEAHIFFKSKIVRAEMFFASPKPVKKMRLNQFLKVEPPSEHKLVDIDKRLKRFQQVFANPHYEMPIPFESEDIKTITETLQGSFNLKPFERGIAALITLLENEVQKQRDLSVPYEAPGVENEMSAFTKIFVIPLVLRMIGEENQELFSLPLIRRGSTLEEMKHIERLCGKSEQEALKIASSVIADIENATRFPPEVHFEGDVDAMLEAINDLIRLYGGAPFDLETLKHEAAAGHLAGIGGVAGGEAFTGFGSEFAELPEFPELEDFNFDDMNFGKGLHEGAHEEGEVVEGEEGEEGQEIEFEEVEEESEEGEGDAGAEESEGEEHPQEFEHEHEHELEHEHEHELEHEHEFEHEHELEHEHEEHPVEHEVHDEHEKGEQEDKEEKHDDKK